MVRAQTPGRDLLGRLAWSRQAGPMLTFARTRGSFQARSGKALPDAECNLVIVHTPGCQALSDFEAIKSIIAARAPDVEVFILANRARHSVSRKWAARRRTLVFSPVPIEGFSPLRGRVYACRRLGKVEEIRRITDAGLRVPESVMITPGMRLDPDSWGPFAVVKPTEGRQGRDVRLVRTCDVQWTGSPTIAQRFIDTGPYARHHRVTTVFGRAVFSMISTNLDPRPPLDRDCDRPGGLPIASNAGRRQVDVNSDPDVIAFAREISRFFPEIPVLGIDMIREAGTGLLYGLEVNSAGFTWHLSSDYARPLREKYGLDLYGQFGALEVIAEALIEVTRREAE
jgi:hypothetical protein